MINAKEAREIAEINRQPIFDNILKDISDKIEIATKDGQRSIMFEIPIKYNFLDKEIEKILQEHNYETMFYNNGLLSISW